MDIKESLKGYIEIFMPKVGPGQFTYERFCYWLVENHPEVAAEALAKALRGG